MSDFSPFFFLDEKETKNQDNSPTSICPAKNLPRIEVRTELPNPAALLPTYAEF